MNRAPVDHELLTTHTHGFPVHPAFAAAVCLLAYVLRGDNDSDHWKRLAAKPQLFN